MQHGILLKGKDHHETKTKTLLATSQKGAEGAEAKQNQAGSTNQPHSGASAIPFTLSLLEKAEATAPESWCEQKAQPPTARPSLTCRRQVPALC